MPRMGSIPQSQVELQRCHCARASNCVRDSVFGGKKKIKNLHNKSSSSQHFRGGAPQCKTISRCLAEQGFGGTGSMDRVCVSGRVTKAAAASHPFPHYQPSDPTTGGERSPYA